MGCCVLAEFINLILKTRSDIGDDAPLERVIEVVINDAMAVFADKLRESWLFDRALVEEMLGYPLDREFSGAAYRELSLATKAKQSPITTFTVQDLTVVAYTIPDLLRPVANRGTAARVKLWRLLWLTGIGIKMPVIVSLLRERHRSSKAQLKALDDKFLWRLRRRALDQLAETIAPLLPSPTAAAA